MNKPHTIYAIATSEKQANDIVDILLLAGYEADDLSVLFPDTRGREELVQGDHGKRHSKAPEGAVAGVAAGGVVGGTIGLLAGIGALAIPGVGPLIAAGPLLGALGAAAAGAAVGGIGGGLVGLGIPEHEARRIGDRVGEGNYLISVHVADAGEVERVEALYRKAGAEDIAATAVDDREQKVER